MKLEIPRYSAVRATGGPLHPHDFICVDIPNNGDEPNERAVMMFSGKDETQRFIETHKLTDWVPAFIEYRELRDWLTKCAQEQVRWGVIDFNIDAELEFVMSFRIADAIAEIDAIAAINPAALESGEPIFVEGQSLLM